VRKDFNMNCAHCGNSISEGEKFCPQCGNPVANATGPEKSSIKIKSSVIPKIVIGIVLFIGLGYYFLTLTRNYHPVIAEQPSVGFGTNPGQGKIMSYKAVATVEGSDIVIGIDEVTKHGIIRFNDPEGIQTTPVIAYISPRGKVVTAMSISEACRSTDFYLEGKTIHCASCPSYWDMESLEAYACCQKYYPDPIPSRVERGVLRISKDLVQQWRTRL
jgi:hypothetical protein